jgi:hypothetical protein
MLLWWLSALLCYGEIGSYCGKSIFAFLGGMKAIRVSC